ncbi:MAG: hypothetical protein AAFP84_06765 [Actinomycetota bacterium]
MRIAVPSERARPRLDGPEQGTRFMAKKRQATIDDRRARYEYRVWGKHRSARKGLERRASSVSAETVRDCYLLVGDSRWNAKVRNNTLKVKRLVEDDDGFQHWVARRHRSVESAPSPFDEIFERLRLDRPQRGKPYDLRKAVRALDDADDVDAVFVVKRRRRYTVGEMRAESTEIEIVETGEVLHTLSVDGDDLAELTGLLSDLGLDGEPNVAVHDAIAAEVPD